MAGPIRKIPRWLDRAGFEADKLMRANRVRMEAARIREDADNKTHQLALKVLELSDAGIELQPELQELAQQIRGLQADIGRKEDEIRAINAEQMIEGVVIPAVPQQAADPIAQRLQAYIESKTSDFNCPSCGTIIRANKSFCPKCGRKVLR